MKPIIFNPEMARAILDGRKTQTRRVIKLRDGSLPADDEMSCDENGKVITVMDFSKTFPQWQERKCPYGVPGDKLWVKETWNAKSIDDTWWEDMVGTCSEKMAFNWNMYFKANNSEACEKWRPSRFMPKAFSRITLEIKDIRVERVQDITDSDIVAEGVSGLGGVVGKNVAMLATGTLTLEEAELVCLRDNFIRLWDSINLKRGYGYDVNPWVFVVVFEKI